MALRPYEQAATASAEHMHPIAACSSKCSTSAASKRICLWFVPSADLQKAMGLSGSHLHCETVSQMQDRGTA